MLLARSYSWSPIDSYVNPIFRSFFLSPIAIWISVVYPTFDNYSVVFTLLAKWILVCAYRPCTVYYRKANLVGFRTAYTVFGLVSQTYTINTFCIYGLIMGHWRLDLYLRLRGCKPCKQGVYPAEKHRAQNFRSSFVIFSLATAEYVIYIIRRHFNILNHNRKVSYSVYFPSSFFIFSLTTAEYSNIRVIFSVVSLPFSLTQSAAEITSFFVYRSKVFLCIIFLWLQTEDGGPHPLSSSLLLSEENTPCVLSQDLNPGSTLLQSCA